MTDIQYTKIIELLEKLDKKISLIEDVKNNFNVINNSPISINLLFDQVKEKVIELVNNDAENKTYIREWLLAEYRVSTIKEISEDREKLIKLYDMLNKIGE